MNESVRIILKRAFFNTEHFLLLWSWERQISDNGTLCDDMCEAARKSVAAARAGNRATALTALLFVQLRVLVYYLRSGQVCSMLVCLVWP